MQQLRQRADKRQEPCLICQHVQRVDIVLTNNRPVREVIEFRQESFHAMLAAEALPLRNISLSLAQSFRKAATPPAEYAHCRARAHTSFQSIAHTTRPSTETMSHQQRGGGRKVLLPPINFIFKLLQQQSRVQIWLYEQLGARIEGKIRGFDEFMNLVIDDAVEIKQATKHNRNPESAPDQGRRHLGMFERQPESRQILNYARTNPSERRQRLTDSSFGVKEPGE